MYRQVSNKNVTGLGCVVHAAYDQLFYEIYLISHTLFCNLLYIVPAAYDQAQRKKEAGGQDSHLKRLSLMLLPDPSPFSLEKRRP